MTMFRKMIHPRRPRPSMVRKAARHRSEQRDRATAEEREVSREGRPEPERVGRMRSSGPGCNPLEGRVRWAPVKSLWYTGHAILGLLGLLSGLSWDLFFAAGAITAITLCCGHTVGLHRLLIHRTFRAPRWVERSLVYLGTLVGMGGPFSMIYLHDIRDWAQRHRSCHPYYIHRQWIGRDWWYNLHCRLDLENPPVLEIEPETASDRFYRFLQRTWMVQQLVLAIPLFLFGGWTWVFVGVSGRIALSLTGHWLIGYFAHNRGDRDWHLEGHSVQGYNLPHLGVLTMGECWHNNHHAFPESARLGNGRGQADPGWWFILLLQRCGLARDLRLPESLPPRPERVSLPAS